MVNKSTLKMVGIAVLVSAIVSRVPQVREIVQGS